MNKKLLAGLAVFLGIVFIILAVVYFITPAHALPVFLPGHDTTSKIHFKHGIGSLILGLGLLAFAWFQSGKKKTAITSESAPHKEE